VDFAAFFTVGAVQEPKKPRFLPWDLHILSRNFYQWELYRPYIGLIHGRYLQFRILRWPLILCRVSSFSSKPKHPQWTCCSPQKRIVCVPPCSKSRQHPKHFPTSPLELDTELIQNSLDDIHHIECVFLFPYHVFFSSHPSKISGAWG